MSKTWRDRLAGTVVGAVLVGVGWLAFGQGESGSKSGLQVSNGVPVVFAYLDDVHVASYLAQLQGGTATTEMLSREATQSKNLSIAASGANAGASATAQSAAQLSLTVTGEARFAQLKDLLQQEGSLRTIDTAAPDREVRHQFKNVRGGQFIKLQNCTLSLPNYVRAEQLARTQLASPAKRGVTFTAVPYHPQTAARRAFRDRQSAQGLPPGHLPNDVQGTTLGIASFPPDQVDQASAEMAHLVNNAGPNPLVPLSSCSPHGYDPNVPDLLMPIRLRGLAQGVTLSGTVTVVGKVMLKVRGRLHMEDPGKHEYYVDLSSIQQWSGAPMWTGGQDGLVDESTVLGPGYVIQPIAIFK